MPLLGTPNAVGTFHLYPLRWSCPCLPPHLPRGTESPPLMPLLGTPNAVGTFYLYPLCWSCPSSLPPYFSRVAESSCCLESSLLFPFRLSSNGSSFSKKAFPLSKISSFASFEFTISFRSNCRLIFRRVSNFRFRLSLFSPSCRIPLSLNHSRLVWYPCCCPKCLLFEILVFVLPCLPLISFRSNFFPISNPSFDLSFESFFSFECCYGITPCWCDIAASDSLVFEIPCLRSSLFSVASSSLFSVASEFFLLNLPFVLFDFESFVRIFRMVLWNHSLLLWYSSFWYPCFRNSLFTFFLVFPPFVFRRMILFFQKILFFRRMDPLSKNSCEKVKSFFLISNSSCYLESSLLFRPLFRFRWLLPSYSFVFFESSISYPSFESFVRILRSNPSSLCWLLPCNWITPCWCDIPVVVRKPRCSKSSFLSISNESFVFLRILLQFFVFLRVGSLLLNLPSRRLPCYRSRRIPCN